MLFRSENGACKVAGRFYATTTANAQLYFWSLNPLYLDTRLVGISDAWQEFRFTRVNVRAWLGNIIAASPSVTPGGANLALAYEPGVLGSYPSSVAECMNLQNVQIGNGTFGCPYPHLKLASAALHGPSVVRWYRRGTAYDDTLESQGLLSCASTDTFSARPLTILVEYEIEFRAPADTALTGEELKVDPTPAELQAQLTELQRVLGVAPRIRNTLKLPLPIRMEDGYVDAAEEQPRTAQTPSRTGAEMKTADNAPLSARSRAGSVAMVPPRSAR